MSRRPSTSALTWLFVSFDYDGGETTPAERWRDLWVIRFDDDGRCVAFEEWPFAPRQRDGHEHSG